MKDNTSVATNEEDLLDDIERALFKAHAANRPFLEELLWMAFLEAAGQLEGREPSSDSLSTTQEHRSRAASPALSRRRPAEN